MTTVSGLGLLHDPELGSTRLYLDGQVATNAHPEVAEAWPRWEKTGRGTASVVERMVATGLLTPGLYGVRDLADPSIEVALVVLEDITSRWVVAESLLGAGGRIDPGALEPAGLVGQGLDEGLEIVHYQ